MFGGYLALLLLVKSRPAIAKAAGITNAYLGQIIKGTIPSREVLINLAVALRVPAPRVLGMAGKPMEGSLLLIRGLPGSGKTTMARNIINSVAPDAKHYEADMYFAKDGVYAFDASKLKEAHEWCISQTKAALARDEKVIVSNTFVQRWEMVPYLENAQDFRLPSYIIEARGDYGSKHAVPESVIRAMKDRWDDLASDEISDE